MDTWNEYRVVEKRRETGAVTAFVLEAVEEMGGRGGVPVEPGSHVRIKLGGSLVRAYSVVGGTSKRFTIGVALDPSSRGGSKFLHGQVEVDNVLTISRITPSFPLAKEADTHVIVAGGIGITAFLAALERLDAKSQNYELHFAVSEEVPFAKTIEKFGSKAKVYNKSLGQRLDLKYVLARADTNTHIYCCGPPRLMSAVASTAKSLGVADSSVHFEEFTVTTSGDPFTAELKQSGKTVEVGGCETLLDVLRKAGLQVDSSCEVGNCGACKVDVCSGRIEHRGTGLVGEGRKGGMLSCVSRGVGKIVLDL